MTRNEAIKYIRNILKGREDKRGKTEIDIALETAIEALEQQPCDDCISRQAALEAFGLSEKSRKYGGDHSGYNTLMKYEIQDILEDLPSVTAQPKMGLWARELIRNEYGGCIGAKMICSECGQDNGYDKRMKFCPNCGCKMQEVEE